MADPRALASTLPEVVPSRDLPEVVPPSHPEVSPSAGLHPVQTPPSADYHYQGWDKRSGVEENAIINQPAENGPEPTTFFGWSRRKLWIVVAIVAFIVIGVVVGAAVGTTVGKSDLSSSAPQDPPTATNSGSPTSATVFGTPTSFPEDVEASSSVCHGSMCPKMLSFAYESDSSGLLFGLGANGQYSYRKTDGETWTSDWEQMEGSFLGQPSAITVNPGRVDVLGIWEEDRSMRRQTYRQGSWDVTWSSHRGVCFAAPVACSPSEGTAFLSTLDSKQQFAIQEYHRGSWEDKWHSSTSAFLASSPATACSEKQSIVLAYGQDKAPYHLMMKRWNSTWWSPWIHTGGDFKGDPEVARVNDATAFFGISSDGSMQYGTWSDDEDPDSKKFVNLGGDFGSVASTLVTGNRIDVVAVGTDGRLKHNALVDGKWRDDWEDLGGFFDSAPLIIRMKDQKLVSVFGISTSTDLIHGVWEMDDSSSWQRGEWFADGGNFTNAWFRAGPA